MTISGKVDQMQIDLAKIVNLCNTAEDYGRANIAQSCLTQLGNFSDQLAADGGTTSEIVFVV